MTVTTNTASTGAKAPDVSAPVLPALVGDVDVFRHDRWKTLPAEKVVPTGSLPKVSTADVWEELNCGLVTYPLVRVDPPTIDVFQTRLIVNNARRGYVDPEKVRASIAGGASLILEHAELWCQPVAQWTEQLGQELTPRVSGTILVTPSRFDRRSLKGLVRADAGEQIFVVVLEGEFEITVAGTDGNEGTPGSLSRRAGRGRAVYVPAATECTLSSSREGLVLVLRAVEPSVTEISELALALFLQEIAASIAGSHHLMLMPEKVDWLRHELLQFLQSVSSAELTELLHGK